LPSSNKDDEIEKDLVREKNPTALERKKKASLKA
jgi:hypothetical protein